MKILCWWFGCQPDKEEYQNAPLGYPLACKRCDCLPDYADLVGDTKHNRFKKNLSYWLFRKWIPAKCEYCGRRWRKCDESIDHIPF